MPEDEHNMGPAGLMKTKGTQFLDFIKMRAVLFKYRQLGQDLKKNSMGSNKFKVCRYLRSSMYIKSTGHI